MNILGFTATQTDNVIKITPDTYGMQWMQSKPTGKLIIDGTGAVFTGTITLPDTLADVDFINFTFQDVPGEPWRWAPSSEKPGIGLNNVRFINGSYIRCGACAIIGTWSKVEQQLSLSQGIEFSGNVIRDSKTCQILFLSKSYGLKVHDNQIINAYSPNGDASHEGLIYVHWSDGDFYNNIVRGGGGNAFRVFPAGLNGKPGLINIHDNYVVDMRKHSAVEGNGYQCPTGYNGVINVYNNTFGNLAKLDYESAGFAIYPKNGSVYNMRNNVVFNTSKGYWFSDSAQALDQDINNFYFPTADAAGVDLATGKLLPSSVVYGKAGAWLNPSAINSVKMELVSGALTATIL